MQRIGSFLVIIGLLSIVTGFFNHVPRLLIWIYKWGEGAAWGIKIGLIVLGSLLFVLSGKTRKAE